MPITASKTDADTKATTLLVSSGVVAPVMTVVFVMPIHCKTGSGTAAVACAVRAAAVTRVRRVKVFSEAINLDVVSVPSTRRCFIAILRWTKWIFARQCYSLGKIITLVVYCWTSRALHYAQSCE